jgi:hypothetical protein
MCGSKKLVAGYVPSRATVLGCSESASLAAMAKNSGSGYPSLPRSKYTAWRTVSGKRRSFGPAPDHLLGSHLLGSPGFVLLLSRALDGRRARLSQEPQGRLATAVAEIKRQSREQWRAPARCPRSLCREVAKRRLSRQGERVRKPPPLSARQILAAHYRVQNASDVEGIGGFKSELEANEWIAKDLARKEGQSTNHHAEETSA